MAAADLAAPAANHSYSVMQDENSLDLPEWDYLYIQPSAIPQAGDGLFTAIAIYQGENIAEYRGTRLSDAESDRRIALQQDDYFLKLPDGQILDAQGDDRCAASYANDAQGLQQNGSRNNARFEWLDDGRVMLVATRRIPAGAEILCAYGQRYWAARKKRV